VLELGDFSRRVHSGQWRDGPCQLLHDYDGDDDDDDDRDMSGADVRGGANILNSNYCSSRERERSFVLAGRLGDVESRLTYDD